MPSPITNMLLPNMMLGINTGSFGKLEGRLSHYGALNTYYRNTTELFDQETLDRIRATPFTRTIEIPIFTKYDHTILTIRTCTINTQSIGVTKKTITRVHVAFDVDVIPADYADNYATYQEALRHKLRMAKKAVYTYLDQLCAAHLDTNKDTTQVVGANRLYTGAAGEFQIDKTINFYNNLLAIMEQMDINGPYFDVSDTVSLADMNILRNPGGGAALDTKAIMTTTQIQQFEYTNRLSAGTGQRSVHYVAPIGSVGILNFIDYDYQEAPDLNVLDMTDEVDISDVRYWGQINDSVFPDWKWGVMQVLDCDTERKTYKAKHSADFALVTDFASVTGESPIKRFSIMAA